MKTESPTVYDVLGIGFGPSNLALAIAIEEQSQASVCVPLHALFFEKQERFGWHRGMLIEGTTMQVCFLKDLAMLRNPTSPFTFLSYLHDKNRLVDFVNHKILFSSRVEFHDYLEWAAAKLKRLVQYDAEVVEVSPVICDGVVKWLDVVVQRDGNPSHHEIYRTHNLVIAPGLEPTMPPGISRSERVWHSSEVLDRIAHLTEEPQQFTVVGAGQSAAEITAYLHDHFKYAKVRSIFSRYGYSAADDSPFTNRIFDPLAVDEYYQARDDVKKMLLNFHRNTNYSVVDADLLEDLYRRHYQEMVRGESRLEFMNVSKVFGAVADRDSVDLSVEFLPTGDMRKLRSDIVVFGSGYKIADPIRYFSDFAGKCIRDSFGQLRVARNYRICTSEDVECGIYLQGTTEHTHGLSSTLLSNTAVRAGEILEAMTWERDNKKISSHA
ncbi:FAD-NAD(P)-binding family protein [Collimonas fungivorans]|uniref:FAD-NAD(P)-binding family protein n=1 Tax=Collimonas fungivorans TaxID=158899 RepID=A0A127P6D7_9BURK|nr:SidA/IucD/PvdA family monooxygenase [Collimonas fungivorans]AMO93268.1 FAD-NAD(P)-binding family protein [Collimonas fungivorans]